jgi:hypothetical protein
VIGQRIAVVSREIDFQFLCEEAVEIRASAARLPRRCTLPTIPYHHDAIDGSTDHSRRARRNSRSRHQDSVADLRILKMAAIEKGIQKSILTTKTSLG